MDISRVFCFACVVAVTGLHTWNILNSVISYQCACEKSRLPLMHIIVVIFVAKLWEMGINTSLQFD